jgi:hypothetical protein
MKLHLDGEVIVGEDEVIYGEDLKHIGKSPRRRFMYYEVFA